MTVLEGILALAFLIVVHEAGHFFVARWCKMRVERFSVGFGPGLLKYTSKKSGTTFQLAPLPFGGFVEIQGMNIVEDVDPEDKYAYPNRPVWQRFLTILAGPATNYIAAVFIAFVVYSCQGMESEDMSVFETRAGFDSVGKVMPGEQVLAVDGTPLVPVGNVKQLSELVNAKKGKPVTLTVRTEFAQYERVRQVELFPKLDHDKDKDGKETDVYRIGMTMRPDLVDVGLGTAVSAAVRFPVRQTQVILKGFYGIFTGEQEVDPGGPKRIVSEFTKAFDNGFRDGLLLMAALSVYLGLFNVLPLPALDGGRLAFLAYEMVTRRRANPKIEATIHMAGIMVLGVVLILVTLHDFNILL